MPTSFDLFGTLVAVERPDDPEAAVTDALGSPAEPRFHATDGATVSRTEAGAWE